MSDLIPSDETRELPPAPAIAASGKTSAPEDTTPLPPLRSGRPAPQQLLLVAFAVALAAFLVGISIGVGTRGRPDESVVASAGIGRDGGVVRFSGGQIRVPEGAVARRVRIVVRRSVINDRVRVQSSGDELVFEPGRLTAYRFEPSGATFRRSVEIVFRLPEGSRNGTVFARSASQVVMLSGTVDIDRGTATIRVRDFRFNPSDR